MVFSLTSPRSVATNRDVNSPDVFSQHKHSWKVQGVVQNMMPQIWFRNSACWNDLACGWIDVLCSSLFILVSPQTCSTKAAGVELHTRSLKPFVFLGRVLVWLKFLGSHLFLFHPSLLLWHKRNGDVMCWLLMKKCSITELFIVNELNIVWIFTCSIAMP